MPITGTNVGTTYLNVTANTAPYQSKLKGLTSIAGKLGKVVGGAFAVASLAKFGKQCVSLASDLQEVNNVTGKAFAGMRKEVDEWAQGAKDAYGLSETMAKSYAGTFGAMAGAFGFNTKEAFNMSTALAGLAGDVASFYNVSQDEAFTKLKSVFTGETESLKGLGVVMTQTALDQYALANGFGKTTAQMTEAEKVSLRYGFVLNQLKFAQGDFAQTVGSSWANQIRLLKLNFDSLKATIGKSLIAILMPIVKLINTILNALTVLARKFNNVFERLTGIKLDDSTTQVSADLSSAVGSSNDLGTSLGNTGGSARKASKAVKELKRQLMGFDKINKLDDTSTGGSGGSVGGGGVGGGSVGGGGGVSTIPSSSKPAKKLADTLKRIKLPDKLLKAFDHLKNALAGLWDVTKRFGLYVWEKVLKPLGKWALKKLAPVLVEALASAIDFLVSVLEFLKPIAKWIWEKILVPVGKFIGKILIKYLEWTAKKFKVMALTLKLVGKGMAVFYKEHLKPLIDKYAPKVKEIIKSIGEFIKTWVLDKVANIVGKIDAVKTAIKELVEKPAEIKAEIATKWSDLKDKWTALTENIQDKTAEFKASIATKWADIKDKYWKLRKKFKGKTVGFHAKIATKWADIKDRWYKLRGRIEGKTANMRAKIATKWGDIKQRWHNITNNIQGKTASMKAKIATAWSDLKTKWNNLISNFKDKTAEIKLKLAVASQNLKSWINTNVIDRINNHVPDILKKMGLKIPRLAQGGYVARNTPRLAVIGDNTHEGEIVAPESKLQAMADKASGNNNNAEVLAMLSRILQAINNVDTDAYIDGKKITDVIVKQINQNTRATGHLAIEV